MTAKFAFLFIIAALLLSGCNNKFYDLLYYDQYLHDIKIPGYVAAIDIIDYRNQGLIKDIDFQNTKYTNHEIFVHPPLTNKHKELINLELIYYFTGRGEKLKVICYIVNTAKKITRSFFGKREFVQVEMSIALYDENSKLLDFSTTISSLEHKAEMSVKYELDLMFEKTIRNAMYQCFDEFKSVKKTVTLGGAYRYSLIKKED
jgi:hypothetical protein